MGLEGCFKWCGCGAEEDRSAQGWAGEGKGETGGTRLLRGADLSERLALRLDDVKAHALKRLDDVLEHLVLNVGGVLL